MCGNTTCVFLGGPKGGDGEKKQQKLAFSWHHVLQTLESWFLSECRSGLVFEHVGHSEGKLVYLKALLFQIHSSSLGGSSDFYHWEVVMVVTKEQELVHCNLTDITNCCNDVFLNLDG